MARVHLDSLGESAGDETRGLEKQPRSAHFPRMFRRLYHSHLPSVRWPAGIRRRRNTRGSNHIVLLQLLGMSHHAGLSSSDLVVTHSLVHHRLLLFLGETVMGGVTPDPSGDGESLRVGACLVRVLIHDDGAVVERLEERVEESGNQGPYEWPDPVDPVIPWVAVRDDRRPERTSRIHPASCPEGAKQLTDEQGETDTYGGEVRCLVL